MGIKEKEKVGLTYGFMLYNPAETKLKHKSSAVFDYTYKKESGETTLNTFEIVGESSEDIFRKLFLNFVVLAATKEIDGPLNEFAIAKMQNRLINSLNSLNE